MQAALTFTIFRRLRTFRAAFNRQNLRWLRKDYRTWGWGLSLLAIVLLNGLEQDGASNWLYLIHGFFLFKFLPEVYRRFRPPVELLLLFYLGLLLLDAGLVSMLPADGAPSTAASSWLRLPHALSLAILFTAVALIVVHNGNGRCRAILWFALLCLLADGLLFSSSVIGRVIFLALLLLFLLRQTRWLEELNRTELWIYLVLAAVFFFWLDNNNPLPPMGLVMAADLQFFHGYASFFWLTLQFFMLAVVIKIPVVMIYNHARLSRKLWISGLFQSTVPQFIQLVILVLMFYFLLAGWQAERFRSALLAQLDRPAGDSTRVASLHIPWPAKALEQSISIPGFEPLTLHRPLPVNGIIALDKTTADAATPSHYFLFKSVRDTTGNDLFIIAPIDSALLARAYQRTPLFLGNQLVWYPFYLKSWQAWFYRLEILGDEDQINFFPFSLLSQPGDNRYTLAFESEPSTQQDYEIRARLENLDAFLPIFGRVISPLFDNQLQRTGYFTFDIAFRPRIAFFTSPIFRLMVSLAALYLFINVFVIRRVVRFGSEINNMIVQKFNHLKKGIQEIARGNLDYQVEVEGEDEFVELANHFNALGVRLKENIREIQEKERLQQELKIARQVQLSMLPRNLPAIEGFEAVATLRTANEVGGDFYDIVPLPRARFLFTVGDVSGKSTSAAFYMAQCLGLIRYSCQFSADPLEILQRINRYFAEPQVDRQIFVTALLGVLNPGTGSMELVRAGHPPALLVPADAERTICEIASPGMGLGLTPHEKVFLASTRRYSVTLQPGDLLVLYSDGVIEAGRPRSQNGHIEFYGEERFRERLEALRGESAPVVLNELLADLNRFYGDHSPSDDYTLVVLRRLPH